MNNYIHKIKFFFYDDKDELIVRQSEVKSLEKLSEKQIKLLVELEFNTEITIFAFKCIKETQLKEK